MFYHLISLVNVEDKPRRLAEDEDNDDGEEEGRHGFVPPVAGAQGVVKGGVARIIKGVRQAVRNGHRDILRFHTCPEP